MTHGKRRGPKGSMPSQAAEHSLHVIGHTSHTVGKRRRPRGAPSVRSWAASATLLGMFALVTGFVLTAPHAADDLALTTVHADDPALQSGLPADGATPPWVQSSDGTSSVLTGGVAGGSLTHGGGVPQVRTGVPPVVSGGSPLTTGGSVSPAGSGGASAGGSLTASGGVPQVRSGVPPVAGGGPLKIAGARVDVPTTSPTPGTTTPSSTAPSTGTPSPSKSASPKASPKASPTPTPTKTAAAPPPPSSFPNAADTGVPSGVTLKQSSSLVITQAGTVISGLNVNGCVDVKAVNVVITDTRITCNRSGVVVRVWPGGSVVVSHSEIDGLDAAASAIGYDNYTLDAVDIHDCVDGISLGTSDVVENSYVHDLAAGDGTHNDAIQTVGGSDDVVRGNTLEAYQASTGNYNNSAIQTGHLIEALSNVTIEDNYMDGGNYTVNAGSTSTNGYPISGYVFESNVFGPNSRYGPVQAIGPGTTFDSSNVWASNGKPVN